MNNIDKLLGDIASATKELKAEKYKLADEATESTLKIEKKLTELGFTLDVKHVLHFNGGAEEVRDDICGFYKAFTWKNCGKQGYRIVYQEYWLDFVDDGFNGDLVATYKVDKVFGECSSELRAEYGGHLENFLKECLDEIQKEVKICIL